MSDKYELFDQTSHGLLTSTHDHVTNGSSIDRQIGWLVVLGLTALRDSISVYIGPSPREREKEKRSDR